MQFEALVVSQDEPFWSINMKKAVASKLQLHVSGSRSVESASRNFGLPTEDSTEDVNTVFKVLEVGSAMELRRDVSTVIRKLRQRCDVEWRYWRVRDALRNRSFIGRSHPFRQQTQPYAQAMRRRHFLPSGQDQGLQQVSAKQARLYGHRSCRMAMQTGCRRLRNSSFGNSLTQ